jgi:acyl-CoA reductase-like NAD-dependent aldehyde dehydrogenase
MNAKQIYDTLGFSFADHIGTDLGAVAPRDGMRTHRCVLQRRSKPQRRLNTAMPSQMSGGWYQHPPGLCGVMTAFNFPVAVWAWSVALALVCGNAVIWNPSEKTPLCALAVDSLFAKALRRFAVR